VREETGEAGRVVEEVELGEQCVELVASGGGGAPAGEAPEEAEDGGRSVRVGWRR
jgi:hypothetical protein